MVATTNHLVDSLDDRQHLFVADLSVAVDVVQLEGPVQLVLHLAPTCYTKGADELFEIDRSGLIGIEDVEDIICEGRWIAERKKLLVDFLKLFLGEHAGRAVLQESYPSSVAVRRDPTLPFNLSIPLYHCCSSFLSKCVAFWRSASSCCDSLLWL